MACDVLPAYAGMIRVSEDAYQAFLGAPRVCGDDPTWAARTVGTLTCSPRMRG